MLNEADLLAFMKALSAWIEKEKQILDELQILIRDLSLKL